MPDRRFHLGELVCFRDRSAGGVPESFEITALLPSRGGSFRYKISAGEGLEHVVGQDDIELLHGRPANSNIPAHLRNG